MDPSFRALLDELETLGIDHDAGETTRERRMLNITRDTGEFLTVLLHALRPARILEVGTSNGYSTLWLAAAARGFGGHVTTVEASADKVALAAANFARAGLTGIIDLVDGDARAALAEEAAHSAAFIFLDADRSQYVELWPHIDRVLSPGGMLVIDNACSHADEVAPLSALIDADPTYASSLVPIGKGELVAVKRMSGPGCSASK